MARRAVADALATAPAGDDVDEALQALLEDADAGVRASAEYARMTQAAAAEDKLVRRRLRGDGDDEAQSSSTAPPPAEKPPSRERWRARGAATRRRSRPTRWPPRRSFRIRPPTTRTRTGATRTARTRRPRRAGHTAAGGGRHRRGPGAGINVA